MNMQSNSLNIITWNARGITNKQIEFFNFIIRKKVDIVLVTETWLNGNKTFSHPNFVCYRLDRESTRGGGVAILIRKGIEHSVLPNLNLQCIEILGIDIALTSNSKASIFCAYFPGGNRNADKITNFKRDLQKLFRYRHNIIIGGDLNCRHQLWNCLRANCWGNILCDINDRHPNFSILFPPNHTYIPSSPKKSPSTLDFFITNSQNYCSRPFTHNKLGSDHLPVDICLSNIANVRQISYYYKYSAANWNLYKSYIGRNCPDTNLEDIHDPLLIDSMCSNFTSIIKGAADYAIPKRPIKDTQPIQLPSNILYLIQLRNAERRKWVRYRYDFFLNSVKFLNKAINKEIFEYRNCRWGKLLSSFDKASNPFWKVSKLLKKRGSSIPPLKVQNQLFITPTEKANLFATNFSTNNTTPAHLSDPDTICEVNNSITTISQSDITLPPSYFVNHSKTSFLIKNLKSKKSPGLDSINNTLLKHLPLSGTRYLTTIFNACLKLCYFPVCWKKASIIPIHKPSKPKNEINSYRPISLLCSVSKLLEKIIKEKIDEHIETYHILPSFQFGFRQSHNTIQQVARIKKHIKDNFNYKKSTGLIMLDIEKAFDTVWHEGLLHKFKLFNFPMPIIKIIQSFLSDREFVVILNKKSSSTQATVSGVPQGSVLGPILFNIFVADLPQIGDNVQIAMFADDTAIFASGILYSDVHHTLQESLNKLEDYFKKWKIKINAQKTKAIWFSRRRKPCFLPGNVNLHLGSVNIEWSEHCRYLGIMLDKKLSFNTHISVTINKINRYIQILYPMISRKSELSKDNKIILFKSVFQSILLYGAPVWGDCAKTHKLKLQRCQNKVLKIMLDLPRCHSTHRLHELVNINFLNLNIQIYKDKFYRNCSLSDNELVCQLLQ